MILVQILACCIVCIMAGLPAAAQTNTRAAAQPYSFSVVPSSTDSQITTFNDPHVCWLPGGTARNQLLVFLPGTNGLPRENFPFAITAAEMGFHVIFLMYPDTVAAQQICPNSNDPNAYMKFRLAIIQGGQFEDFRVLPPDSIENRLAKLLVYLGRTQPGRGWDQYVDRQGQIDWSKIVISGHSQGGGHSYVIAKIHPVARVIEFGSPKDYSFYFRRPAGGFDSDTKTPLGRFFAFNHMQDRAGNCTHDMQMEILKQMRLTDQGMVEADTPNTDFHHAHLIFTNEPVPNMTSPKQFHTSVINGVLSVDPQVWVYMLTEPVN